MTSEGWRAREEARRQSRKEKRAHEARERRARTAGCLSDASVGVGVGLLGLVVLALFVADGDLFGAVVVLLVFYGWLVLPIAGVLGIAIGAGIRAGRRRR